jgi:hypothetical protein
MMRPALLLALLSSISPLVSGLSGSTPEDGFTSLENAKFYQPSQSELKHIEQSHAEAIQVQAANRPQPKSSIAEFRHRNVTQSEVATAQKLVEKAADEQSAYNEWIINNPRKNNYRQYSFHCPASTHWTMLK